MGQALYRKYRSKSLNDIVGQEHITTTLKNAIKQNRVSHAYLFSGPRGVGKTSVARIFAYAVNNLDYKNDVLPIDIIEIDAASNRRIDEIRELRDRVYIAPAQAKYKVYIIDEVHMLTREAFNALLKTLEEPPEHVIFILATTEIQKLPETIISRTQRYSFKPASDSDTIKLLETISKSEKFSVDKAALEVIAKHSRGSYRDAVSLLDQLTSNANEVSAKDVEDALGLPPHASINELTHDVLEAASFKAVMARLSDLYGLGFQAEVIAEQMSDSIRSYITDKASLDQTILKLLGNLYGVPAMSAPDRSLELALLNYFSTKQPAQVSQEKPPVIELETEPAIEVEQLEVEKPINQTSTTKNTSADKAETLTEATAANKPRTGGPVDLDDKTWLDILTELKKRSNTLYGVIRMAEPDFSEPGRLILAFEFPFHEKRLSDNSNRQRLVDIILDVTGQSVIIEGIVDKSAKPAKPIVPIEKSKSQAESNDLTAISNIFGNAELLESEEERV